MVVKYRILVVDDDRLICWSLREALTQEGYEVTSVETGEDAIKEEEEEEEEALPDLVYINPELLKLSRQKTKKHEGCLSIRKKWGEVMRAEKATIRAYDENGVRFTRGASGFLAHIFQHEMDHLDGILYSDKATAIYDEQEERKQK